MKHIITEYDKDLLLQPSVNYHYKLIVKNGDTYLDELTGITSVGDYSIDSDSDVRRTTTFSLLLDDIYYSEHVEKKISEWVGYDFELQIAIEDTIDGTYQWYRAGTYTITQANTTYDAANNIISTDLSDWFAKLNGVRNGQIGGAPTIIIPNEDEDGNKITIQQATIGVLGLTTVKDYIVQDVGEFYGMEQNNDQYEEYRTLNPNWNQVPYDLEHSCGDKVGDIIIELRDLYPNCEAYFDIYNNFCFNMIPSCDNDPISIENDFLQSILIAENTESVSYDIETIKNVTEVFGKIYETDRYAETATFANNTYTLTLSSYTEYQNGEIIAFKPTVTNGDTTNLVINSLSSIPIYYEYTTDNISSGDIVVDEVQCVKIAVTSTGTVAYYLGQFQPHAICVLTNNLEDTTYTKEYFKTEFNCDNVTFSLDTETPFSVQKKGLLFETLSGDEFDNIISNSVATANAIYYNQKASIMNDTVTITTKMIPWLDVNIKVSYRKQQESEEHQYIIKSVVNSLESMTSTITMYRFSPLYFD